MAATQGIEKNELGGKGAGYRTIKKRRLDLYERPRKEFPAGFGINRNRLLENTAPLAGTPILASLPLRERRVS